SGQTFDHQDRSKDSTSRAQMSAQDYNRAGCAGIVSKIARKNLLSKFWLSPIYSRKCTGWCGGEPYSPHNAMYEKSTTDNNEHRRNQMKFNKWTLGLAAIGVVSLASAAKADEKMSRIQSALSSTTIS